MALARQSILESEGDRNKQGAVTVTEGNDAIDCAAVVDKWAMGNG